MPIYVLNSLKTIPTYYENLTILIFHCNLDCQTSRSEASL